MITRSCGAVTGVVCSRVTSFSKSIPASNCGTSKEDFLKVAEAWGEMAAPDKAGTILYALGWTQHTTGSQIIRTMAMVQLLLGRFR